MTLKKGGKGGRYIYFYGEDCIEIKLILIDKFQGN